ncbi:MAG TPA: hypothetical protein VLI21_07700 [Casimicrobiaceae bacterium]|nr:hypothetical protein [Casimicrobiaceae bacterium]
MAKRYWHAVALAACLNLLLLTGTARADDVPMVTGEHWVKSSDEAKKAYLIGIANVLQIEHAYQATSPPTDAQSLVPRWAKGLKGQTLDTVRDQLNRWYAAHPDQLRRPVLETIWFEIVVPGSSKPS